MNFVRATYSLRWKIFGFINANTNTRFVIFAFPSSVLVDTMKHHELHTDRASFAIEGMYGSTISWEWSATVHEIAENKNEVIPA